MDTSQTYHTWLCILLTELEILMKYLKFCIKWKEQETDKQWFVNGNHYRKLET